MHDGSVPAEADKAFDASVLDRSVQVSDGNRAPVGTDASYVLWVSQLAETILPWGTNPKARDRQLRAFFPSENYFMGALGTVCARNAGFGWTLDGSARTVGAMQKMLHSANFGAGWLDFVIRYSIDLYTQDHGAFVEFIREAPREDAPIIGIATMDSLRCFPTGDPETPVLYLDDQSRFHGLKWFQVKQQLEMPAPNSIPNGGASHYTLQYSALSRILRAVQVLKNVAIYQDEKLSGRFQRAIHLVKGVDVRKIDDAMAKASAIADNMGLTRYMTPAIIGGPKPDADVGHDTIELATLPDAFKFEELLKWYITLIAMGFNTDYQEFAPLPGGNLGTSGQSEVLHMKNRGKGPALFQKSVSHMLNTVVLPDNVSFGFDEQDLEADKATEEIKGFRATRRSTDVTSGVLDVPAARQQALDDGDVSREIFDAMGQRDIEEEQRADDERRFQPDPPPLSADAADAASAAHGPQPDQTATDLTATAGPGAKEAVPPGRQAVEADAEDEVAAMLEGVHERMRQRIRGIRRTQKEMERRAAPPRTGQRVTERHKVVRDERGGIAEVVVVREDVAS